MSLLGGTVKAVVVDEYQLVPCSFISDLVLLAGYATDAARSYDAFEFVRRMQEEINALAAAKEK